MHLCTYLLEFHEFSCFVKLCELGAASSDYLECEEERKEWIKTVLLKQVVTSALLSKLVKSREYSEE